MQSPMTVMAHQYPEWFTRANRIVIKVGSSALIHNGQLKQSWFASFMQDLASWHQAGKELLVVSSGAVALGREGLGLTHRPRLLKEKQAASAIGQIKLAHAYDLGLAAHNITVAQVLPTLSDTENRQHYLNLCETLGTLLAQRVIPILNENDAVANAELRFGDNDRLAARIAQVISADTVILLSDIDGLFTSDPRKDPSAQHLAEVQEITAEIEAMGGGSGSNVGTGGMASKLLAARIATTAGCDLLITNASPLHPLATLLQGGLHTRFVARQEPMAARKQWLAGCLNPAGSLTIDAGAAKALQKGGSLLAVGTTAVQGNFERGDVVTVLDANGRRLANGLVQYSAAEAYRLLGHNSKKFEEILGFSNNDALIHHNDLALL